jgi:hypothetical protein
MASSNSCSPWVAAALDQPNNTNTNGRAHTVDSTPDLRCCAAAAAAAAADAAAAGAVCACS